MRTAALHRWEKVRGGGKGNEKKFPDREKPDSKRREGTSLARLLGKRTLLGERGARGRGGIHQPRGTAMGLRKD